MNTVTYWIIIDSNSYKPLYGLRGLTIMFSTEVAANEFGSQLCDRYEVYPITLEAK